MVNHPSPTVGSACVDAARSSVFVPLPPRLHSTSALRHACESSLPRSDVRCSWTLLHMNAKTFLDNYSRKINTFNRGKKTQFLTTAAFQLSPLYIADWSAERCNDALQRFAREILLRGLTKLIIACVAFRPSLEHPVGTEWRSPPCCSPWARAAKAGRNSDPGAFMRRHQRAPSPNARPSAPPWCAAPGLRTIRVRSLCRCASSPRTSTISSTPGL